MAFEARRRATTCPAGSPDQGPSRKKTWGIFLLRLGLAGIFLYAGGVKASASQEFALALAPFTLWPGAWLSPLAITLAWTELGVGALLLLPRSFRGGALLAAALSLGFIALLTWALAEGIVVNCGCFGGDETPSATKMLLAIGRDLLIFAAAIAVLAAAPASRRKGRP